jgi:hypothetical protein
MGTVKQYTGSGFSRFLGKSAASSSVKIFYSLLLLCALEVGPLSPERPAKLAEHDDLCSAIVCPVHPAMAPSQFQGSRAPGACIRADAEAAVLLTSGFLFFSRTLTAIDRSFDSRRVAGPALVILSVSLSVYRRLHRRRAGLLHS